MFFSLALLPPPQVSRMGRGPSLGTALHALTGVPGMFHPFVFGCWPDSADVTGRLNPTSLQEWDRTVHSVPPSFCLPAPSAPPHVPEGAYRPVGSLLCHMQALGNWEGLFLPKYAPLRSTLQVVSFQGSRPNARYGCCLQVDSPPLSWSGGSQPPIHLALVSS